MAAYLSESVSAPTKKTHATANQANRLAKLTHPAHPKAHPAK